MAADLSFLPDNIHLVSIPPDGGGALGRWFGSDRIAAQQWADERNALGEGVYFTANIVRPGFNAKPTKADIIATRCWHVDVDSTSDPAILQALNPSVIIHSGNGVQGLWFTHGDVAPFECEEINRRIAHRLQADHCHNIDRLLRVPGTVNWPSAVKRARGRVPVWSSLVSANIAQFPFIGMVAAFEPVPVTEALGEVESLGEWTALTLDEMRPPLDARLYQMCTTVMPDGQRSEYVTKCVKALGGAGYSNEQIMGLLMHPANVALSGTIYAARDPERQARRKLSVAHKARIDPAKAFATPIETSAPMLDEPVIETRRKQFGYGTRQDTQGGIMLADQQMEYFKGLVWVNDLKRILSPRGTLLDQTQFNALYSGYRFVISLDGAKTVPTAWEGFLSNQRYSAPTVDGICFRPHLASFEVVEEDGKSYINTYMPTTTRQTPGDASPFLNHVHKMFPHDDDAEILLTYMSSCIRNPGMKAQWWPVVQGVQGNGKTMLLEVMENCIGKTVCHRPNVAKMTRNGISFNSWVMGALFLGIEEIHTSGRRDFLNEFKPYITNTRLSIESKGMNEFTGDNYANGIMLTNHDDGVPIDDDERRYCPLFAEQQSKEDMQRDGMTSLYFTRLWDWLRNKDGFAIINHYLRQMTLRAEYDPAQLASRAPRTSATRAAVVAGRSRIEQEISEAIAQGRPGFCGGWVSSSAIHKLLLQERMTLSRNLYDKVMKSLGYVRHPDLTDGRSPIAVAPDHGRPRLWVTRGHLSIGNCNSQTHIAEVYSAAQMKAEIPSVAAAFNKPSP